jgi:hypothetical protein
LREPADLAARDRDLARRFAAALPRDARIVDLGAGTGANARALAPLVAGDQHWLLVEHDAALRAAQRGALLAWALRSGLEARDGADIEIAHRGARWRFTPVALDLAAGCAALDVLRADAVSASAFFDLVSEEWIEDFARWLGRCPLLAALTVDGRRRWSPPDEADALVAGAFGAHQRRDKGFGPALGPRAPDALARALAGRGHAVTDAPSDWRLGPEQAALIAALAAGEAEAAAEMAPAAAATIAAWRHRRLGERPRLEVGHRDLLALPG